MPITLLPRPPMAELLQAVSRLIRLGVPPLTASPAWADPQGPAPAGHWLLPAGARVYQYDEPEAIKSPACIIYHGGDAVQKYPDSRTYWTIPLRVDIMVGRKLKAQEIENGLAELSRVLTETLPTGDPATASPWARLSVISAAIASAGTPWVHIFSHGIRDVQTTPLRSENGHPVLSLSANIFCGTIT